MSHRRAGLLALVVAAALGAGCRRLPPNVKVGGENEQVEIHNTLGGLVTALRAQRANVPEGPRDAWLAYETNNAPVLRAAGALPDDPGDVLLAKIAASPDATLTLVEPFDARAPEEATTIVAQLEQRLGNVPPVVLAFGAAREWQPVFQGTLDGRPLVLLNARHVSFATPGGRKAGIARALFARIHEARVPQATGLGPLARRVYREGASALAVRALVPDAQEQDILELEPAQLTALRAREALIARELLAGLDSANEAEVARFFSRDMKDPLLPRGAGRFISDKLYQRLAAELGSLERPLKLEPAEFLQRARRVLEAMAKARPQ